MCGIAGILSVKHKPLSGLSPDVAGLEKMVGLVESGAGEACGTVGISSDKDYLGGMDHLNALGQAVCALREMEPFYALFERPDLQKALTGLAGRLAQLIAREEKRYSLQPGRPDSLSLHRRSEALEKLKDIAWCLKAEVLENVEKVRALAGDSLNRPPLSPDMAEILRNLNLALNSLDRLEVRGRDSAGLSVLMFFDAAEFDLWMGELRNAGLAVELEQRAADKELLNHTISLRRLGDGRTAAVFTYKIAAEIGCLGDNVRFLRGQIAGDALFRAALDRPAAYRTIVSHTRWASVGGITELNCHPQDNRSRSPLYASEDSSAIIQACLNGDIDNYLELKADLESRGLALAGDIGSDTKIIPLRVACHYRKTHDVLEAFRLALNEFKGSHAVILQTDLAPGKLFLAQRGSGQALFVGLAPDFYLAVSEVYGLVEATSSYIRLEGEKVARGRKGSSQGQIFVLDQDSPGGLSGIRAWDYDGVPLTLTEKDIKSTPITSRDTDRQGYLHYFMKEISESPLSVEKTLQGRWRVAGEGKARLEVVLDGSVLTDRLRTALARDRIRRIVFIGQGTAGVAAQACAELMKGYLDDASVQVQSMKASELSSLHSGREANPSSLQDTLVVAISQSGTTTDTNRTVDLVRARGAHTLGVVNRRDSDLTFKVDGVLYTSSGRDIEMSVASTKAFYAQVVAGALLGLAVARLRGHRSEEYVSDQVRQLLRIPEVMRRVLDLRQRFEASAQRTALRRTYWAVVGSGPNKAAADEIRIKLSELCYKTISSDFIEDKKHIDLSSEPIIIVCAAGAAEEVLTDLVKETAIFRAHKAVPLIIADEDEARFAPYAEDVFPLPRLEEHLAPIIVTLAGHLWGYYAALAIHEGSRFLDGFRRDVQDAVERCARQGQDVYDLVLDQSFRETMARFYAELRRREREGKLPLASGFDRLTDLFLLLKYLSGRLPASDFELDFGVKGTALNMLNTLLARLGEAINRLARPVDAIRHQAKTVTVGTSRISDRLEGLLFDTLAGHDVRASQLTARNVNVLKYLQAVVAGITGSSYYRIEGLNLLGEPTDQTTIEVLRKGGTLKDIPSRVETDNRLQGTKHIIVRQGNVYIGKGRKDGRSILVIPILSASPSKPNMIEYLLLLHITFREGVALEAKVRALGGKYEHLKNIVQETGASWDDLWLDKVAIEDLFGLSAEKVAERILARSNQT
jgi:glucosamine--fructose-6-phosphate aminotransferase (isomerizing)